MSLTASHSVGMWRLSNCFLQGLFGARLFPSVCRRNPPRSLKVQPGETKSLWRTFVMLEHRTLRNPAANKRLIWHEKRSMVLSSFSWIRLITLFVNVVCRSLCVNQFLLIRNSNSESVVFKQTQNDRRTVCMETHSELDEKVLLS